MKSFYLLFALLFAQSVSLHAQKSVPRGTVKIEKQKKDTATSVGAFISHQADAIVGSIFGPSKQLGNADSIINKFDANPSFGIYKDNYFAVGTQTLGKPNRYNSDAKFQISVMHRITNSTLPFKTYAFFTYTQKAFWDVFQESFPFHDLNYNPTLGIGKALVRHNRFLGTLTFQFEHESNGKDGEDSRSWNKVSFGSCFTLDDNLTLRTKAWIPIVDGANNKDIIKYSGWGLMSMEYSSSKKEYNIGCVVTKRGGVNLNANVELNFSIRLFSDDNQYLFLQYYNGYGESMLDYNRHRQCIRLGFVIKPSFITMY